MPLHLTAGNMSAKSVQNQNWAKVSVCSFKVRQGPKWDKFFSRQIVLSINIVPLANSSSVPVLWIEGSPSILASAGSNISLKCRCLHKRWLLISDHWTIRNTEKGKFNWKKKYWDDNSQWLRTSLLYLASFHPFICTPCEDLAKENQILLNSGARAGKEGGGGGSNLGNTQKNNDLFPYLEFSFSARSNFEGPSAGPIVWWDLCILIVIIIYS